MPETRRKSIEYLLEDCIDAVVDTIARHGTLVPIERLEPLPLNDEDAAHPMPETAANEIPEQPPVAPNE